TRSVASSSARCRARRCGSGTASGRSHVMCSGAWPRPASAASPSPRSTAGRGAAPRAPGGGAAEAPARGPRPRARTPPAPPPAAPQQRALLPRVARGELLLAYGLSEPDVGGDLASVAATARRSADGGTVVLNGTKRWCTGARVADYILCLVRSGPEAERYRNLSLVLVPPGLPGVTIVDIDHLGLRYAATTDVLFDEVRVPLDDVLGGAEGWNQGWRMLAGPALDVEKLEITAVAYGIAAAAVEDAWRYAQERRQFGKPICAHQSVRH